MNLKLDESQRRLRDAARQFADTDLRPRALERDRSGEFPLDSLRAMAALGLMGVNIRSEYGGAQAGVVAYSLAVSEIAKGDPAVAVTMAVNNMVCEVIQQFGTEEQRRRYIPKITGGEFSSGSFLLSEPGSGSDAASMRTRAERTDGGWIIDGSKAWITSGTYAGVYLVWAKSRSEDGGRDAISLFIVDPKTPGISVGKPEKKMGQHASDTVPVTFERVEVPADALLGEFGQGFKIAMMALDGGRIGIASQSLGIGLEALAIARRRLREHPHERREASLLRLADITTELEAARLLTLRAAWLKEQGNRPFSQQASMAKMYTSEAAWRACERAVELLGADGYRQAHSVEKLLRDARVTRIYEGTNEIQRVVIARNLIRQGA